jgi:hypothetical protein
LKKKKATIMKKMNEICADSLDSDSEEMSRSHQKSEDSVLSDSSLPKNQPESKKKIGSKNH